MPRQAADLEEALKKKGGLTLSQLANYDDLITDALVDRASLSSTALRQKEQRQAAETSATSTKNSRPMTGLEKLTAPASPSPTPSRSLPGVQVLITTDLGSRGIDTLLVKHVILYDVPHTSIDFIHRLGRVGRMGRRGRGVVLVGKGDRRDVVAEVRGGMFRGMALI
ncbi:hypothetical protein B0A55_01940 [Friedmanniomyces simplex]|uniref:RNA helicase n=1 Tax=Friedmanniomyces simplex TaxID=329884 RepID=A0A4U0XYD0_9PEZI|nr:hypothetical protein B0A55_01940 [Friedmanniomyces simplex]